MSKNPAKRPDERIMCAYLQVRREKRIGDIKTHAHTHTHPSPLCKLNSVHCGWVGRDVGVCNVYPYTHKNYKKPNKWKMHFYRAALFP